MYDMILSVGLLVFILSSGQVNSAEIATKDGYYLTEEDFENGRKIDPATQIPRGEVDPIDAAHEHGKANYQGDIMLTPKQLQQVEGKGRALSPIAKLWPGDGTHVNIPYIITDTTFTSDERANIARAVKEFEKNTCIRFVDWKGESDYIDIVRYRGCSSYVGKIGGRQMLSLARGCAGVVGIPIHEFMHATGYKHEQSRNDRDEYITINWSNIEDDKKSNFDECERCDNQDTPYDYASVMHYGSHAFSKNGRPTITANNNEEIGQRNGFSYYDLVGLNKIYSCKEQTITTEATSTTDAGNVIKEFDVRGTETFDLGKGLEHGNEEFFYEIVDYDRAVIQRDGTWEMLPNGPEEFNPITGKTDNGLDVRGPVYSADTYLGKVWWKIVKIDKDWPNTMTIQIVESQKDHRSSELSKRENYDLLGINGTKNINSEWIEPLVKGSDETCHDNWKLNRCKRLRSRGKCGKKRVAKNCQKTCGLCSGH